jgi:hypothetical protein
VAHLTTGPRGEPGGHIPSKTDRRTFLAVTGSGAAAGTVALTAGPVFAAGGSRRSKDAAAESVVAYVEDHRSGKLRLMLGDREVVVHDSDLVTRILNAAGGK